MPFPFDPGLRGWDALSLYRKALGIEDTVSGRHYANLVSLREQVLGELWSAEAWIQVARVHLLQGDLETARRALVQALLIGTSDPESMYLLGWIHCELGEFEQAEKPLTQLVRAKPFHEPALLLLLHVLGQLGRELEAGEPLLRAVMADPANPEAHRRLGNWFREHGDLEEAVDEYERALAAEPAHTASLLSLGCALLRLGQEDRARQVHDRLEELSEHLAATLERFAREVGAW